MICIKNTLQFCLVLLNFVLFKASTSPEDLQNIRGLFHDWVQQLETLDLLSAYCDKYVGIKCDKIAVNAQDSNLIFDLLNSHRYKFNGTLDDNNVPHGTGNLFYETKKVF